MAERLLKILCFVLTASLGNAWAQDYPARPVKIIVPYAAGGVPDVLTRVLGQRLSEALSEQFLVENKPGAGGISAMMAVVNAPPDGYTLILADAAQTAANAYLFNNLPYDTLKDLVPISLVGTSSQYVAGSPQFATFTELVAFAKANPGKLSYGSAGVGSVHHIGMESIKSALGLDLLHVPYKGSGQSVPAFVAGEVQVVFASLPALLAHVKAGKAKLLAVTSPKRSSQTPDVPAVAEFIPGYDFVTGMGLLGPVGTPPAVIARLTGEVAKVMQKPDVAARLIGLGIEAVGGTPEAYAALIRNDLAKYSIAVKISGAKATN